MAPNDDPDIETLGTRIVYENRWMRLREDAIRRRDGSEGIYTVVEKPDFVVIVPIEEDGRIHLVQQYRYRSEPDIGNFRKAPGRTCRKPIRLT